MGRDWDGSSKIELRWDEFCENVKHKARFFEHAQFNRSKELSKLNETFLTLSINVSTTLYRARNANKDETLDKILMCKRKKNPYIGLSNFVGGKLT